jgi:hypothetical protein
MQIKIDGHSIETAHNPGDLVQFTTDLQGPKACKYLVLGVRVDSDGSTGTWVYRVRSVETEQYYGTRMTETVASEIEVVKARQIPAEPDAPAKLSSSAGAASAAQVI